MDMTKKIAVIGTHGVGKSTLAYALTTFAKEKGFNALCINEVVRDCPFPINEGQTINAGYWTIVSQMQRELQAIHSKYSWIICDRSAFDPIMYLKGHHFLDYKFSALERFAEDWLRTYDHLIFVQLSDHAKLEHDGIRNVDAEFQALVNKYFEDYVYSSPYKDKILIIDSSHIFKKNLQFVYREIFGN
jgi:thymidylate kinase